MIDPISLTVCCCCFLCCIGITVACLVAAVLPWAGALVNVVKCMDEALEHDTTVDNPYNAGGTPESAAGQGSNRNPCLQLKNAQQSGSCDMNNAPSWQCNEWQKDCRCNNVAALLKDPKKLAGMKLRMNTCCSEFRKADDGPEAINNMNKLCGQAATNITNTITDADMRCKVGQDPWGDRDSGKINSFLIQRYTTYDNLAQHLASPPTSLKEASFGILSLLSVFLVVTLATMRIRKRMNNSQRPVPLINDDCENGAAVE